MTSWRTAALVGVAVLVWACERAGWRWPLDRFDEWLAEPRRAR